MRAPPRRIRRLPGHGPCNPCGAMQAHDTRVGPVTRYALLGVVYGVVAGTLWAALSGQVAPIAGALGGFTGGLVGGVVWGAATQRLRRR